MAQQGSCYGSTETSTFKSALGRADLYPGQTANVARINPKIGGTDWLVVNATHTVNGGAGFTPPLELERGATA